MTTEPRRPSDWLPAAMRYAERWLEHQMRLSRQPGCSVAVVARGEVVLERAFGVADLTTEAPLTVRHRFRVASHSKTFTAVAVMLLRERGLLRLDDPVGQHVADLAPDVAAATVGQLLSHAAGLSGNGTDQSHWNDLSPWPDAARLRRDLRASLAIAPGEHHRYSNLGYGLLGLLVGSVTGEAYGDWVRREVLQAAGLDETAPDFPAGNAEPFAAGHAARLPMGRFVIPGTNTTDALAAATGFVSTPRDLARFFGQLDPAAPHGILSVASRREMIRRHWRAEHSANEVHYGLGIVSGSSEGHDHFGHSGSFQGYQSRTCVVPDLGLSISVVINAIDGPANAWVDALMHILARFAQSPPPTERTRDWAGRWWNLWGVLDLVPVGDAVLVTSPDDMTPFTDADEIEILSPTTGRVRRSAGYRNFGEPVERTLPRDGSAAVLRVAGDEFLPEEAFVARQATPAT